MTSPTLRALLFAALCGLLFACVPSPSPEDLLSLRQAIDSDGDGFDSPEDCDDADPTRYPGAPEGFCDGVDLNCDGMIQRYHLASAAAIPDSDPMGLSETVTLSGPGVVDTVTVVVDLSHDRMAQLSIDLLSPSGTVVRLWDRTAGRHLRAIEFDDRAWSAPVSSVTEEHSGALQPATPLAAFDGEPLAGDWTLHVVDHTGTHTGQLEFWTLYVEPALADCDGDGSLLHDDCDDFSADRTPGSPEVHCDDIDNDCDGWADGSWRYEYGVGYHLGHSSGFSFAIGETGTITHLSVDLDIEDAADLQVVLTSPSGVSVVLWDAISSAGPIDLVLDDRASLPVSSLGPADAPFTGSYRPVEPLSAFDGEEMSGSWRVMFWRGSGAPLVHSVGLNFERPVPGSDCDGDGWEEPDDCDDTNPTIYPAAPEGCDLVDQDCDGLLDLRDLDEDGQAGCLGDCDDARWTIYEGAPEVCDGEDNDCDGLTDEGPDLDGDGFQICDCDDGDPAVSPSGVELLCDQIDNDCDGSLDNETVLQSLSTAAPVPDLGALSQDTEVAESGRLLGVELSLDLTHPRVDELSISLTSPAGTVVPLWQHHGGEGSDLSGARFHDDAPAAVADLTAVQAPFSGGWRPAEALGVLMDEDIAGLWTLTVTDDQAGHLGELLGWSLELAFAPGHLDCDGDGFTASVDCHDHVPTAFPGAPELCDLEDHDCDGEPGWIDLDLDGVGGCEGDCDEGDAAIHPGAPELCDDIDNDCSGLVDDGPDLDGDGHGACDCDDTTALVYPEAPEASCDGLDNDCDGWLDIPALPAVVVATPEIVPDDDPAGLTQTISVAQEGTLEHVTVEVNISHTWVGDLDLWLISPAGTAIHLWDNYGHSGDDLSATVFDDNAASSVVWIPSSLAPFTGNWRPERPLSTLNGQNIAGDWSLRAVDGAADDIGTLESWSLRFWYSPPGADDCDEDGFPIASDCDDSLATVFPGAPELCDGLDNDCDAVVPSDELDTDSDGFLGCEGDCDPTSAAVWPGAPEVCDGLDNDCSAATSELADDDADGHSLCDGDCDDADPSRHPAAPELCDSLDNNCDDLLDNGDADGDGSLVCDDCDDSDPASFPGASEGCDLVDNDCDGLVDEGFDLDGDGHSSCGGDCDDADASLSPSAEELCDGLDNNCDGWLSAPASAASDPDSLLPSSFSEQLFVNLYQATHNVWISELSVYLSAAGPDSSFSAVVYSRPDESAPWTLVESAPLSGDSAAAFYSSGPLGAVIPAGQQVALGVHREASSDLAQLAFDTTPESLPLPGLSALGQLETTAGFSAPPPSWSATEPPSTDFSLTLAISLGASLDEVTDADLDGAVLCDDCDDLEPARFPGNNELCDGLDNDCDSAVDEGDVCCPDADGDGFADITCGGLDCDDTDPSRSPAADESCDGIDNDCDSLIDDGLSVDADGDGHSAIGSCEGLADDCDDTAPAVSPSATELCDGADNDCDGLVDDGLSTDADGDGHTTEGSCEGPDDDCDDTDASRYPGADELCDGADSDCDGSLVDDFGDFDNDSNPDCIDPDDDNDGDPDESDCADLDPSIHGAAAELCDAIDSDCDGSLVDTFPNLDGDHLPDCIDDDADGDGALAATDCDDLDPANFPGNPELCDGQDNDCDGADDVLGVSGSETDDDGDLLSECEGDCDDSSATVAPDLAELCDELDNNCDGLVDEGFADSDGNGVLDCLEFDLDGDGLLPADGDCDNDNADIYPGAPELCDAIDNNCDGAIPDDERDLDADEVLPCEGDCDNEDPLSLPGAPELCDGADNDCDGVVPADENDTDADGLAPCQGDCDDLSPTTLPGAPELCDGVDNDCDGALPADESDADSDGQAACAGDCDDTDPASYSGASELCDGADNDCDGVLPTEESDADGDGLIDCLEPAGDLDGDGQTTEDGDCDDTDPDSYTGAPELCDAIDNDCDGVVPADELDLDDDGWLACDEDPADDCDDEDPLTFPGAPELCDGIDNDCDGLIADEERDEDEDGFTPCGEPGAADCDDGDAFVFPGADEQCDGLDTDCDGALAADELDADGDGVAACEGDCDDEDPLSGPAAPEVCGDGLDNDCNGLIDDEALCTGCSCSANRGTTAGGTGLWWGLLALGALLARRRQRTGR